MNDMQNDQQGIQNGQKVTEQTLVQFPKSSHSGQTTPASSDPTGQDDNSQSQISQQQGTTKKEHEPLPSSTSEFIAPSEKTLEIEPEVKDTGVTQTVNEPRLSAEDKIAGLEEAMESVPVGAKPQQAINYPIPLEDAEKAVKGPLLFKNSANAMLWLALLVLRQFKMKKHEEEKL